MHGSIFSVIKSQLSDLVGTGATVWVCYEHLPRYIQVDLLFILGCNLQHFLRTRVDKHRSIDGEYSTNLSDPNIASVLHACPLVVGVHSRYMVYLADAAWSIFGRS